MSAAGPANPAAQSFTRARAADESHPHRDDAAAQYRHLSSGAPMDFTAAAPATPLPSQPPNDHSDYYNYSLPSTPTQENGSDSEANWTEVRFTL